MNSLTQFKKISILPFLIALMLAALAQNTQAVSPPPDGGYPGFNTAEGDSALLFNTTGSENTAIGYQALFHNTTGNDNAADGFQALFYNITGTENTATGFRALEKNGASNNTADGSQALLQNYSGAQNTATGYAALNSNSTGNFNTANGSQALLSNTVGIFNSAFGQGALFHNTTGGGNTASSAGALPCRREPPEQGSPFPPPRTTTEIVGFVKEWEIIADNLSKAGFSWGCVSAIDSSGRTIWIVDAHRGDGKRFVVHAEEELTAFLELERAVCIHLLSEQC